MVRRIMLAGVLALLTAGQAFALSCSPKDATARILKGPSPNDVHPDWQGGSNIGTAWTLDGARKVQGSTGTYLRGDLISPRGGVVNRGVFALPAEWDCSP